MRQSAFGPPKLRMQFCQIAHAVMPRRLISKPYLFAAGMPPDDNRGEAILQHIKEDGLLNHEDEGVRPKTSAAMAWEVGTALEIRPRRTATGRGTQRWTSCRGNRKACQIRFESPTRLNQIDRSSSRPSALVGASQLT